MNRFIDLRQQGVCARFAFFNTVSCKFITVFGVQTWNTVDEFVEDMIKHKQILSNKDDQLYIDNFKQLCPYWAFNTPTENELDC